MFYIKELPMTDSNVQIHTNLFSLSPCFKFPKYLNTLISPKIKISNCNICFSNEIWGKGTESFFNPHHLSTQSMALLADLGQFILGSADVIPESLTKCYTCCWLWLQKACLWLRRSAVCSADLTYSLAWHTAWCLSPWQGAQWRNHLHTDECRDVWWAGPDALMGGLWHCPHEKSILYASPSLEILRDIRAWSWTCFPAPPRQPYHLSIFQFLTSCIPPRQAWSNLAYSFDLSLQVTTYSLFYCKSLNQSNMHRAKESILSVKVCWFWYRIQPEVTQSFKATEKSKK